MRRALYTSECEQALIDQCSLKSQQLLEMSRTRLARLGQLIGGRWERLHPCLLTNVHCSPSYLQQLHDEWRPTLRLPLQVSFADRPIRRALQDLSISFVHFNRKWQRFVDELDLEHINQVRLDYNTTTFWKKLAHSARKDSDKQDFNLCVRTQSKISGHAFPNWWIR